MKQSFHRQGIVPSLLISALCLAGGFPSAPIAAVSPQSLKTDEQVKTNAGYKGPGFVLVNVHREPVAVPPHDTGTTTDRQGNVYTTRWDSSQQPGDSSFTGTYKEVMTEVEKATGNLRVTRQIERQGGVSWTPPPTVAPPSFVYRPQPKFSGSAQGIGIPSPQEGGDIDLQIAAFSVSLDWPPTGPGFAQVNLTYGPHGVKAFSNKPMVFPDLKAIQAVHGEYILKVNLLLVATSPTGADLRVTYNYECRPEVTLASVTPTTQEPPKPPAQPVAPHRVKTAPAPASVATPEVTPKPPEKLTPPTPAAKPKSPSAITPIQETDIAEQHFEVYNLGEGVNILQSTDKPKGTLSVDGNKLKYQEAGKMVFSAGRAEIKEIDANTVLGYSTGTFHVILKSGKTYNFAPASLSVADGQKMLESIKHALP